jgi:hypothetical protein
MTQYIINRSIETPEGSYTKWVKPYDSLQEAMDDLYRFAHRRGYEVTIDNTLDGTFGFCLWQIHVKVGEWRYYVTVETDESLELMGF